MIWYMTVGLVQVSTLRISAHRAWERQVAYRSHWTRRLIQVHRLLTVELWEVVSLDSYLVQV